MVNKKEQTRKDKEQQEENRKAQVLTDHEDYKARIEARIATGENDKRTEEGLKPLEVLEYSKWVRKAKNKEGEEKEVSGDSGETKNERFKRLGKSRMESVLSEMDLLINLSAPQYEATPEEIEKMLNALRLKIIDIENSFKSQAKPASKFDF